MRPSFFFCPSKTRSPLGHDTRTILPLKDADLMAQHALHQKPQSHIFYPKLMGNCSSVIELYLEWEDFDVKRV